MSRADDEAHTRTTDKALWWFVRGWFVRGWCGIYELFGNAVGSVKRDSQRPAGSSSCVRDDN